MPRRTLNTKAATTWRKDSSQVDAGKVVYTALKRREHGGALDVAKSEGILINRRRGLTCQRRKLTPQQKQGVRSRLKLIQKEFASHVSSEKRRELNAEFSIKRSPALKATQLFARRNSQPPPRIRNAGSEEVETKVTKPKTTQRRNHVGRYYPRKCKQQFAENPTGRVSKNGTEIPRKNLERRITDGNASKFDRPESTRN